MSESEKEDLKHQLQERLGEQKFESMRRKVKRKAKKAGARRPKTKSIGSLSELSPDDVDDKESVFSRATSYVSHNYTGGAVGGEQHPTLER